MTRDNVPRYFGAGWNDLVDQLEKDLDEVVPGWTLVEAKEKFGGLRFYISTIQEWDSPERGRANELIRKAERDSYSICDECGKPGRETDLGWIRTLCDDDAAKLEKSMKESRF